MNYLSLAPQAVPQADGLSSFGSSAAPQAAGASFCGSSAAPQAVPQAEDVFFSSFYSATFLSAIIMTSKIFYSERFICSVIIL